MRYARQVLVPITYDDITFNEGLRLDVLVEDLVIYELKAVETMHPVSTAQLLIKFTVPLIKHGVKRVIL